MATWHASNHSRFNIFFLQGTGLEIRPEPMRAVDQDAGINASIRYAWNAGEQQHSKLLVGFFSLLENKLILVDIKHLKFL